jgi:hypothetical protein
MQEAILYWQQANKVADESFDQYRIEVFRIPDDTPSMLFGVARAIVLKGGAPIGAFHLIRPEKRSPEISGYMSRTQTGFVETYHFRTTSNSGADWPELLAFARDIAGRDYIFPSELLVRTSRVRLPR